MPSEAWTHEPVKRLNSGDIAVRIFGNKRRIKLGNYKLALNIVDSNLKGNRLAGYILVIILGEIIGGLHNGTGHHAIQIVIKPINIT